MFMPQRMQGVLYLDRVTPIIEVLFIGMARPDWDDLQVHRQYSDRLFKGYTLDMVGSGQAKIDFDSRLGMAWWYCLCQGFRDLAERMNLPNMPQEGDCELDSPTTWLRFFGKHFKVDKDEPFFEDLLHSFWDHQRTASFDELVYIAKLFDDGHGLRGYSLHATEGVVVETVVPIVNVYLPPPAPRRGIGQIVREFFA